MSHLLSKWLQTEKFTGIASKIFGMNWNFCTSAQKFTSGQSQPHYSGRFLTFDLSNPTGLYRFTGNNRFFFGNRTKSDFEDFTSPAENYSKYKNLKNDLVRVQRRLSKMDIVEWHEITGSLHPANHVMDKVRVIWGHFHELTGQSISSLGKVPIEILPGKRNIAWVLAVLVFTAEIQMEPLDRNVIHYYTSQEVKPT